MIQFACPSCSSTCAVDDKFRGRKLKCPKCGARVLHREGVRVELLTAGSPLPPKAPDAATAPAPVGTPVSDITPLATAVLPHSMGQLMDESESKQNLHIVIGLLLLFAVVAIILGIALGLKLLVVGPIAVVLSASGIYLWQHTRKIQRRIAERKAAHAAAGQIPTPKSQ